MNRIRFLRNEREENLEKLAEYLQVTVQTISNYETEKREMTPDTIIKIANYFNVSTDYLLGKTDIRNIDELRQVRFANSGGLDLDGLDEDDMKELQEQIDFIKFKKNKKDNKTE